jgi:hypothetical protein
MEGKANSVRVRIDARPSVAKFRFCAAVVRKYCRVPPSFPDDDKMFLGTDVGGLGGVSG